MIDTIPPAEGLVVYGIWLHLDSVSNVKIHPTKAKHLTCSVEAKKRPLLIVRQLPLDRGRHWFVVLPITSKGLKENGETKPEHIRIGRCIDEEHDSYVKNEPTKLPLNLIDWKGPSDEVKPINRLDFMNALKIVERKLLGGMQAYRTSGASTNK